MLRLASVTSGEVACLLNAGRLVWCSVLSVPKLDEPISSARSDPLASWMELCQRLSWALRSPMIIASPSGKTELRDGL